MDTIVNRASLTAWTRKALGEIIKCFAVMEATISNSLSHMFDFLDIRCPREPCEPHRLDSHNITKQHTIGKSLSPMVPATQPALHESLSNLQL